MVFASLIFICFFLPVVLLIYYLLRPFPVIFRNCWLLISSLFFYAWGEPYHLYLLVLSIAVDYLLGYMVSSKIPGWIRKCSLVIAILFHFGILFLFKYLESTVHFANEVFKMDLTIPSIALPIGISFYTFQAVSYIVDVYRQKSRPQADPIRLGLYISFFPQLVAGPIVRYETISEQLKNRKESLGGISEGMLRFCRGLGKKVLIANILGNIVDQIFQTVDAGNAIGILTAWLGAVAYTLQIFFDFSGYSDMAIGLGKMFGFTFEENFNYPYIAASVTDFWRRWHISLSRWFRDYVYIPLGGSRVTKPRLFFNLFVVWMFTGIWHGADFTFLFWGLGYFMILAVEKFFDIPERLERSRLMKNIYRVLTLTIVVFEWVIFRSAGMGRAVRYIKTMLGIGAYASNDLAVQLFHEGKWALLAGILLSTPIAAIGKGKLMGGPGKTVWEYGVSAFYGILLLVCIGFLVMDYHNPFLYFNF